METVNLSAYSTFGIGGPAKAFCRVESIEQMQAHLRECRLNQTPFFILGKGSNVLFDDRGFNGLVLQNKIDFFETPEPGLYHVGAGFSFALLGTRTAQAGYSGLEFASGIPASVGGAVFMNAGANGSETAHTLVSVDFVDEEGELSQIKKEDLTFAYRTSPFQKLKGAIVGATFKLNRSLNARQKQLEIFNYRKNSQPYGEKSAGCIFRNPETGPAGKYIEEAGLKGLAVGGASISTLHANFIVNLHGASALEVQELIDKVQKQVYEKHRIELESEVRIIPYEL